MKKSKILVSLLLAFVMVFGVVVALVACDNSDDSNAIELVLWTPSYAQTFYKGWANKWAQSYTDAQGNKYKVSLGVMNEGDVADPLMQSPTDGADVFLMADDQVAKLYQNNLLADLGTGALAQEITARNSASSVASATYDGKLLAYPMQADNTYFLYYNSDILSEEDVETWDSLFAALAEYNGSAELGDRVKVQFAYGTAWYQAAWFFTFDGYANETDTNFDDPDVGYKALQAAYEFSARNDITFLDPGDPTVEGFMDGSLAAGVSGTWIYTGEFAEMENIKMAVLPKIRLSTDPEQDEYYRPMKSFIGSKLIGVNAQGNHVLASHALANYLTSEEVQLAKAIELGAGPSNIVAANNPDVKSLPIVEVVAKQAVNAVPQINLPAGFWTALATCVDAVNEQTTGGDYFQPDGTPNTSKLDELLTALRVGFYPSI